MFRQLIHPRKSVFVWPFEMKDVLQEEDAKRPWLLSNKPPHTTGTRAVVKSRAATGLPRQPLASFNTGVCVTHTHTHCPRAMQLRQRTANRRPKPHLTASASTC
jgi:hypothetical protein